MNHPEMLMMWMDFKNNYYSKIKYVCGEIMKCITYLCPIINNNNNNSTTVITTLDSCVLEDLKMLGCFW